MGGLGRYIHCGMLDLKDHLEMIIFWYFVVKVFEERFILIFYFIFFLGKGWKRGEKFQFALSSKIVCCSSVWKSDLFKVRLLIEVPPTVLLLALLFCGGSQRSNAAGTNTGSSCSFFIVQMSGDGQLEVIVWKFSKGKGQGGKKMTLHKNIPVKATGTRSIHFRTLP